VFAIRSVTVIFMAVIIWCQCYSSLYRPCGWITCYSNFLPNNPLQDGGNCASPTSIFCNLAFHALNGIHLTLTISYHCLLEYLKTLFPKIYYIFSDLYTLFSFFFHLFWSRQNRHILTVVGCPSKSNLANIKYMRQGVWKSGCLSWRIIWRRPSSLSLQK
jgi:hypothetical protein